MAPEESERTDASSPDKDWLTPKQFAGYSTLSLPTVRRRLKANQLPHVQLGGFRCRILIHKSALAQLSSDKLNNPSNAPPNVAPASQPDKELPGPLPRWKRRRRNKN